MKTYLYPYNPTSVTARAVAQGLGVSRIRHEGSNFVGAENKTVINWGAHKYSNEVAKCTVLNRVPIIVVASNKLTFFQSMDVPNGPRIPKFTTEPDTVLSWLADGHQVCIRQTVTGHSGAGLSVINRTQIDDFRLAPLYTQYIKKKDEYRIHFAFKNVIDVQRKALRTTDDEGQPVDKAAVDFKIRNLANGFVFVRGGVNPPNDVIDQATRAFDLSGLDFGAVDVIYNESEGQAYVLEINTAPGLCNTTLESYLQSFRQNLGFPNG